jgi:hypothetical protein
MSDWKVYHLTDAAGASTIMQDGFRDDEGSIGMTSIWLLGVLVSNEPLAAADGRHVLEVVVPDGTLLEHHLVEKDDDGHRQWCVPAAVLNACPRRRLDSAEADRVTRGSHLDSEALPDRGRQ